MRRSGTFASRTVTAVTAHLYDDVGSAGNKTLTTGFAYDEINRLIEDTSPDLGGSTYLTREFKYDSRGNLVLSYDRKGQERRSTYDLLSRPIRHKVTGVVSREVISGDLIDTVQRDIVSRTVYTKNSDVKESIDPNGNRTYFRYDLASRWLQTQHADGGSGTPLKTTAGTTHSISAVGSTVFYSGTSTYDGNSNLLNLKDENDTTFTWTYDNNDCVLTEAGATAGGNPFEIEGETGLTYTYDGLYRAIYGETHDASYTLTETDSVFNSLGGLERQRQRVHRAHPLDTAYTHSGSIANSFDESGRRFRRANPSGVTRASWDFDRKHRPTTEYSEFWNGSSWDTGTAAEYEYLGGGFLHSRQTRYVEQYHPLKLGGAGDVEFPVVSTYERDNLLRVTSIRHERDDAAIGFNERLLGRYDYAYDENSMMKWEMRWYHDDSNGASDTPDETDFYFFDSRNVLEKAVYNATKYGSASGGVGTVIDTGNAGIAAGSHFGDDTDNQGTYSDRVYYTRRRVATREVANWYRGTASGTSNTITKDDTATGPTQRTNYATSDDAGADPDTDPASDGEGSRHNYTVIGQGTLTYDKNRNLLADNTREFRYNYRNQLRHVWRKSDGDSEDTGLLAKYREDAFGRRVYAEAYWELGRQAHFDTRFELDVDVDADNDSTVMDYVDGGITSDNAPGPGDTNQRASWPSLLRGPLSGEEQYIDFFVKVPDADGYLGYVGYEDIELRIYDDHYELWQVGGGSAIDSYYPGGSTAGFHNIGLRCSETTAETFIDGVDTNMGATDPAENGTVWFGTRDIASIPGSQKGVELLENLTYQRSFNRTDEEQLPLGPSDGPRVTVTGFDGPQPITHTEIKIDPQSGDAYGALCIDVIDPTITTRIDANGDRHFELYLPNGRSAAGCVIAEEADRFAVDEGAPFDLLSGNQLPGVAMVLHHDATGATREFIQATGHYGVPNPDSFATGVGLGLKGVFEYPGTTQRFARSEPTEAGPPTSNPEEPTYFGEDGGEPIVGSEQPPTAGENCACTGFDYSFPHSVAATDLSTGAEHDWKAIYIDPIPGIMFGPEDLEGPSIIHEVEDGGGRVVRTYKITVNRDGTTTETVTDAYRSDWVDQEEEAFNKRPVSVAGCDSPGATSSSSGTASERILKELIWIGVDAAAIVGAIALVSVPEPSMVTKIAAGLMFTGAIGDFLAHLGRIVNILEGDEVIDEDTLDNLETLSTLVGAAGALFALPAMAKSFMKALANRRAQQAVGGLVDDVTGAGKVGGRGVWDLGPSERGLEIEKQLVKAESALPEGFSTYDEFVDGVATSIKSVDTATGCSSAFRNTVNGGINDIVNFKEFERGGVAIKNDDITKRILRIAVPKGHKPSQAELDWATEKGKLNEIIVEIVEVGP